MSPRRPAYVLVIAIAVLACSAVVPGAASACVNAGTAKSFKGQAHMYTVISATGTAPGAGGFETATLDREALDLHLNLAHKTFGKGGTVFFGGKMTGGAVTVKDSLDGSDGSEQQLTCPARRALSDSAARQGTLGDRDDSDGRRRNRRVDLRRLAARARAARPAAERRDPARPGARGRRRRARPRRRPSASATASA